MSLKLNLILLKNLVIFFCLLFSISIFSQEKEVVKEDSYIPTSIFAANSLVYQTNYRNMASLRLTGYKFMIVDYYHDFSSINSNRFKLNLENFGRYTSFEDIADNYSKTLFYRNNVTTNSDHFIWNIPLGRKELQKQYEQINNN